MATEEKDREEQYWQTYSKTGAMPSLPEETVTEKGVDYVKRVLHAQYNQLTKLLFAEVLARKNEAAAEDLTVQCDAAKWVRLIIFSKKNNYVRRREMAASLIAFMTSSANERLRFMGWLATASIKVSEKVSAGVDTATFVKECLGRLQVAANHNPEDAKLDEFIQLCISVGWEFVKKHDWSSLQTVLSLVHEEDGNDFQKSSVAKLRKSLACSILQPIRDWTNEAKQFYHALPESGNAITPLMQTLIQSIPQFEKLRNEPMLRNLVLFWLGALLGKLKKIGNGIAPSIGEMFLTVARADGLREMPDSCWERKKMEPPPKTGDGIFPATAEKLVNGLYGIVKERFSKQITVAEQDRQVIEWMLDRMGEVYDRLPDEKWGDFRIGKLLVLLGRIEEARDKVLPAVRRNQTQFWAWSALSELFPEHQKCCIARALLCEEEEQKLVRVKRKAQELGLPVGDSAALKVIADQADAVLLIGMKPVDGVLAACYRNQEGKFRARFYLRGGKDVRPVSPAAVRLPHGTKDGAPMSIYLDEADSSKIIAVRPRDGVMWDVLPSVPLVYGGRSKKGRGLLISRAFEMSCPFDGFSQLESAKPGDTFNVRYTMRMSDHGIVYDVRDIVATDATVDGMGEFEGPLRLPEGAGGFGFVDNVFVSPSLISRLRNHGIADGMIVAGKSVRLPDRMEKDRNGVIRRKVRINAVTLIVLSGEALECYKHTHNIMK